MSEKVIAVKNAVLWNGTGRDSQKDSVILVEGSRIKEVGSSKDVEIPKNAERARIKLVMKEGVVEVDRR